MLRLVYLLIGYGFGCLQSAYIVGRLFGKIDIRQHGSGNAGTTNIVRVMGAKAGLAVLVFDIIKAMAAYILVSFLFRNMEAAHVAGLYAGIGAILGHNFPFFLKFKGGKGMACTVGIIAVFSWKIALITLAVGAAGFLFTQYISVLSLTTSLLFPIMLIIFKFDTETVLLGFFIAALCYYQHRANIKRLIQGKENKFTIKSNR